MLILIFPYFISKYVIWLIYLLTFSRLTLFFSVNITREGGIRIQVTAGTVAARIAVLLVSLGLDLLQFAVRVGLIGNSKYNIIILLEIFQIFLQFVSRFIIMLDGISDITYGSLQYFLYGPLIGNFPKPVIRDIKHVIPLRHSCLLAKHTVALLPMMIWRLSSLLFTVW